MPAKRKIPLPRNPVVRKEDGFATAAEVRALREEIRLAVSPQAGGMSTDRKLAFFTPGNVVSAEGGTLATDDEGEGAAEEEMASEEEEVKDDQEEEDQQEHSKSSGGDGRRSGVGLVKLVKHPLLQRGNMPTGNGVQKKPLPSGREKDWLAESLAKASNSQRGGGREQSGEMDDDMLRLQLLSR
jgi:hypothetical protein